MDKTLDHLNRADDKSAVKNKMVINDYIITGAIAIAAAVATTWISEKWISKTDKFDIEKTDLN
jgi:hypothetical protein